MARNSDKGVQGGEGRARSESLPKVSLSLCLSLSVSLSLCLSLSLSLSLCAPARRRDARVPGYLIQLSRVSSPRPPPSSSLCLSLSLSRCLFTFSAHVQALHVLFSAASLASAIALLVLGACFPPLAPFPCFRAPPQALAGQVSGVPLWAFE